jgi:hypothetical protein
MQLKVPSIQSIRRHRSAVAVAALALTAAMIPALVGPAEAAPDDVGLFELEGDVDNDAAAGDDWANVFNDTDGAFVDTGIIADPSPNSIFTGGGSKDGSDIPNWSHKDGQVPDKDDITNGYAAAYTSGGQTYVYFGLDRLATEGSSFVGAWLLQDESFGAIPGTPAGSTSTFSGQHVAKSADGHGDVLVLTEFDEGGSGITVKVFEWVGTGGDEGGGTLQTIFGGASGSPADCDDTGAAANVCANVNTAKILDADIPWPYEAKKEKGKVVKDIPIGAFFEGGINLNGLFGGDAPCFSDIVLETRSSFETNAVLKDLVASKFELCGADVAIAPDGVNRVGDQHAWTVTATKSVAGSNSPAPIEAGDLTVTLTDANGDPITPTSDECATTNQNDGTCVVTFNSSVPGTITGHVEGNIMVGDHPIAVSTGGVGENPDATKVYVDSKITIDPDDTNGIGEAHTFVVDVEADNGDGGGFEPVTVGDVNFSLTDGAGATNVLDAAASTCDNAGNNLDANGQCTIVFSSATTGTVTGHASFTATLSTTEGNIAVSANTDGLSDFGSANSDDAVKTYVDGSLKWLKHDDLGQLLGGATFQVCRTHTFNSATNTFVDTADVCVTVVDNSAPDVDSTDGEFEMVDLVLGRYTVDETAAPNGYQIDPDVESVDLSIANPNGTAATFVNPALFKVIVLTCNTTTEELVDSTVDLDPGTAGGQKETLTSPPAGLTDAQLCALGGASYDELTRGNYDLQVELPDQPPAFP